MGKRRKSVIADMYLYNHGVGRMLDNGVKMMLMSIVVDSTNVEGPNNIGLATDREIKANTEVEYVGKGMWS